MKRTVFVGQAMPRYKSTPHDWPTLNAWLYSINLTQDQIESNFLYTALVDYFPGSKGRSHIVPSKAEVQKERERLVKTIRNFDPELIVTIGKLSASYCLGQELVALDEVIGKSFRVDPYQALGREMVVVPLPHPSGASTWRHKPENKVLLARALELLKNSLEW